MGNAREIRRNNETALGPAPTEPPALPPRPLVENMPSNARVVENQDAASNNNCNPCSKKYVMLCAACGGLAIILGSLFAVLYVVLRSYTSSLHYFETVPSYVASVSLIVTGLLMLCFGWRRNRFGYLVKLCGACCLVCAVVCVVITVTTTVVHMNRLQTLRECVYNARGRSCTCFTGSSAAIRGGGVTNVNGQQQTAGIVPIIDPTHDQGSAKYIFADTPDCEVVHGALYACLRALFGLSVIGILVSLFSGMLVYQLLGHERKKMYWEQLELRSRALFRRHHPPPCCGCCQDCRFAPASNNPMLAWPAWDVLDDSRYWGLHGGNLYSPGPCANGTGGASGQVNCSGQAHGVNSTNGSCPAHRRPAGNPGWNWLPWRPSVSDSSDVSSTVRTRRAPNDPGPVIIGPDDHYGFPLSSNSSNYRSPLALTTATSPGTGQERVAGWGPPPPYSRGSTSELGSISASTPIGSLSPAHRSPVSTKEQHVGLGSSSTASSSAAGGTSKDSSLRKASDQRASGFSSNLPARQQPNKNMVSGVHPSPVSRMNIDPRRMPWSPQTAGITPVIPNGQGGSLLTRNIPAAQQTGSPSGRRDLSGGKLVPESELYFADTSSYAVSVNHDSSNSSAMYEEIHGHRYDKIQRPVAKVTSIRSGGKPCQRSSWDGQNQRPPPGVHAGGQPRSRHSADTVSKEKMFSPIVVPKFINCSNTTSQQSHWVPPGQPEMAMDTCSFVPYRRAAVVPSSGCSNVGDTRFVDGEVYENVTNLDFDEKKPRTLSPDEEVAILTSQFHGSIAATDMDVESTQMDSESEDNDSVMRAVNV
ncbi:uncharacterized protein LOC116926909 [Daphnia magna]|uniref:Uncharacterized protein n=1 Tax=Daphnia magna TaxID=35525 RepID=A0A0P5NXY6_9CRUS|nr:uncharacterized protein LOC116926909 [Daphnia magna]KAK4002448.1 hypothetical protein OUZ56_004277 [Daphnia magna]